MWNNIQDVFIICFQDYPEDEILIAYDADYKHGENFVIATTVEAKEAYLKVILFNQSTIIVGHNQSTIIDHHTLQTRKFMNIMNIIVKC